MIESTRVKMMARKVIQPTPLVNKPGPATQKAHVTYTGPPVFPCQSMNQHSLNFTTLNTTFNKLKLLHRPWARDIAANNQTYFLKSTHSTHLLIFNIA